MWPDLGKSPHFANFISKLRYFASIIYVWVTSLLSIYIHVHVHVHMSTYNNCTISELQHFVTQPLIPPILREIGCIVCTCMYTHNRKLSKMTMENYRIFWRSSHKYTSLLSIYIHVYTCTYEYLQLYHQWATALCNTLTSISIEENWV